MATDDPTHIRIPLDGATRDLFDEAKALSGITTYTDVVRHAVTTLVRRLRAESKP